MTERETTFGVLGSLALWRGRHQTRIAAAKHRTVLAVLLANANHAVSMDALMTELWSDAPPPSARKTTQGYVWRLRQLIGADAGVLATTDAGYQLDVDAPELDALRFTGLVGAARRELTHRPEAAARGLARALDLWRGPAYASVPDSPTVAAEAARLDEARLSAQELMMTVQLLLGREHEAVPELTWLAAMHPLRESVQRLLMTALFRSGRQLDALAVYRRLQRSLADDYGLDPQRQTAVVHQRILDGTATVELAACV